MRRGIAVALLVLLPVVAVASQDRHDVSLPDDPMRGRTLLQRKGCLLCHGVTGDDAGIGPDLGEGHFSGTLLELGAALWNHVPGMSFSVERAGLEWPTMSERETLELISFLYFTDYLGRPGVASTGARVFESAGCAQCHGIEGEGGGVGPDLTEMSRFASPLFLAQQVWNHGPAMLDEIRRRGLRSPQLQAGDFSDLAAFIRQRSLPTAQQPELFAPGNPNEGETLFSSVGCAICHGADAHGRDGGPDLGAADLPRSAEAIAGRLWNHATGMRNAMAARGLDWPQLEGTALADLVAFLYALPYEDLPGEELRGLEIFTARGCAACHGGASPGTLEADSRAPDMVNGATPYTPPGLISAMWNHAPTMKREALTFGRPWPELTGDDLRHLWAVLRQPR